MPAFPAGFAESGAVGKISHDPLEEAMKAKGIAGMEQEVFGQAQLKGILIKGSFYFNLQGAADFRILPVELMGGQPKPEVVKDIALTDVDRLGFFYVQFLNRFFHDDSYIFLVFFLRKIWMLKML